jgi:hypothetical protein
MKFHKVVAGIGGLAIAGGITLGASVALPSVAQAAPGGNGGGKSCSGTKNLFSDGTCSHLTGSFTTIKVEKDVKEDPILGPSDNAKAKSWTLETTTTTTTETRTDTYDTYQGNGNSQGTDQYLGENTLDTVVSQTVDTSTQKLNPGGDAPEGQQNK